MMSDLKRYGYNRDAKYCVASTGRCGSTMLTLYLEEKFGKNKVTGVHAREFVEFDGKVIFLFGDVFNTVLSTHTRIYKTLEKHYRNMSGEIKRKDDFWRYDSLHIEDLFDDWYRPHEFSMVSIRYESLWDHIDDLGKYLGADLSDFPKKKERKTDWRTLSQKEQRLLEVTYRRINNKMHSAADFKIWE